MSILNLLIKASLMNQPCKKKSGLKTNLGQFMHVRFFFIKQEQMAKTYAQMQNTNRIKRNLLNIEKQKEKKTQQSSIKIIEKMQEYEQKRKKRISQKLQSYKSNQEKWVRKMQQIQSKFRHQNREAIQKAQKLRLESQIFWKNKEQQLITPKDKSVRTLNLNKTQTNSETNFLSNFVDEKDRNSNTKRIINFESLYQIDHRSKIKSDRSKDTLQSSRVVDIDGQISKHKQKSETIQREKQQIIFQKVMERLSKIQLSRKRAEKLKQASISPVQVRKPNKQRTEQNFISHRNSYQEKSKSFNVSKSKDALSDSSIQNHIKAKKLLQQQQFKQRDKILQNSLQKMRKDKIIKAIKSKVQEIKISSIKIQNNQ